MRTISCFRTNQAKMYRKGPFLRWGCSNVMKRILTLVLTLLLGGVVKAQQAPAIKWPELAKRMQPGAADSTVVVNFWATWCKPCLEEMPYILAAHSRIEQAKVRFLLVSLDFKQDRERKLLPFLQKKQWPVPVVLLDESDYNAWIPRVSKDWEGNIPVTLILHGDGRREFLGRELKPGELEHVLGLP